MERETASARSCASNSSRRVRERSTAMGMRDFFRGERDSDRDPWRESERVESRYGRGESERHSRFSQERDWDDDDTDRERGRYGSYSGGVENPRFYGQSGRSDW